MTLASRILIVDDEPNLRKSLSLILEKQGYQVTTASNAAEAQRHLEKNTFDLIFLDIKMPKKSGLELLSEIRQEDTAVPILLLTAFASLESAIAAVRRGANDYLLKPVDPPQIIARVEQILEEHSNSRRREILGEMQQLLSELNNLDGQPDANASDDPTKQVDPDRYLQRGVFKLDLHARIVTLKDEVVNLTPTAFDYLVVLLEHSPQTVSYQNLVLAAQGYETTPIESKEVARWRIHELRKALEEDTRNPRYIITVRGQGYRFVT